MSAYKRNDHVVVWDDPITEQRRGFGATVLRCLVNDAGIFEGRQLRRYMVQPDGEGTGSVEAALLDAK